MHLTTLAALALPLCLSLAPAQTTATYRTFGQGCPSTTPPYLFATKLPVAGGEFDVIVRYVRQQRVGALIFGSSNTRWGAVGLPFDLGFMGAAGCKLLVSWDGALFLPTGSGTAYLQAKIPLDPKFVGLRFYNQFWSPDPQANQAGLVVSNGAAATIGSYAGLPPEAVVEDFMNDQMLDKEASGGTWIRGSALPARIGGSGILGVFDYMLGTKDPKAHIYTFSTDNMLIPGTHTETGKPITVANGVFEFSQFSIPTNVTVRFVGTNPLQIRVRGSARIEGVLQANAPDVGFYLAVNTPGNPKTTGQKGAPGGPGGASGGAGGDSCPNTGANVKYDGRNGKDIALPAGHGYAANVVGTGGKGSPHWPRSGKYSDYCALSVFGAATAAGGGGGGFQFGGNSGVATKTPCNNKPAHLGQAPNSGGIAFDIGILAPKSSGPDASLNHFAVGGSGGGGGGSHALLTRTSPYDKWLPGTTGGGGGGVVALRVGLDLSMATASRIEARGGTGYFIDSVQGHGEVGDNLFNAPSPGGGGSGGSILLQVAGNASLLGTLDTSGGKGGTLNNAGAGQAQLAAKSFGGDGAPGYVRLELPYAPTSGQLGKTIPTAGSRNVGKLTDQDRYAVSQSLLYDNGFAYPPVFLRYEVEATVAGKKVLYSDDPALKHPNFVGRAKAGGPLWFRMQGAWIDHVSGRVLRYGPWRDGAHASLPANLNQDAANAWRFQLVFDKNAAISIAVDKVSVWLQR